MSNRHSGSLPNGQKPEWRYSLKDDPFRARLGDGFCAGLLTIWNVPPSSSARCAMALRPKPSLPCLNAVALCSLRYRFGLQIFVKPHRPGLATIAGFLVAAKRHVEITSLAVDVDHAGPQLSAHTVDQVRVT